MSFPGRWRLGDACVKDHNFVSCQDRQSSKRQGARKKSTNRPQIRISEKKAQLVDIFHMQSVGHPHPRNRHKQIRMAEKAFDCI